MFKSIYRNTYRWKNALKCIKYCLKTENDYLKTLIKLIKHPREEWVFFFEKREEWVDLGIRFKKAEEGERGVGGRAFEKISGSRWSFCLD